MSTNLYAFAVQPYDTENGTSAFVRLTHDGQIGRVSYAGGWMSLYLYPHNWRNPTSGSRKEWEKRFPPAQRFRQKHVDCQTPNARTACRGLITGLLSQWIDDLSQQPGLEVWRDSTFVDGSMFRLDARIVARNQHLIRHGELKFLVPEFCSLLGLRMTAHLVRSDVTRDVSSQHTLNGTLYRVAIPACDLEGDNSLRFTITLKLPCLDESNSVDEWLKQFREATPVRAWAEWRLGDDATGTKRSYEERIRIDPYAEYR